jgi:hypothetical protein
MSPSHLLVKLMFQSSACEVDVPLLAKKVYLFD